MVVKASERLFRVVVCGQGFPIGVVCYIYMGARGARGYVFTGFNIGRAYLKIPMKVHDYDLCRFPKLYENVLELRECCNAYLHKTVMEILTKSR